MPLFKAIAFMVMLVPSPAIDIGAVYSAELSSGSDPSVVYRIVAPLVLQVIVIF